MTAPLPQQQVVLSVTKNKVQLIDLVYETLQKLDDERLKTSLGITGRYPVLMKVRSKALVQRIDLNMTHEEAVGIIPQQVMALADVGCKTINVICDDTDVYVLLAHYIAVESLSVSLIMDPISHIRSSIDIGATVAKHSGIVQQLIAQLMQFSGLLLLLILCRAAFHCRIIEHRCDTVGCYHGIT